MSGRVPRWFPIAPTTPSGKAQSVCLCCGRVSPAGGKACRTIGDPDETWGCSKWEPDDFQQQVINALATPDLARELADTRRLLEAAQRELQYARDPLSRPVEGNANRQEFTTQESSDAD